MARRRKTIHKEIDKKLEKIKKILAEIVELRKEDFMLSDKDYQYEEKFEEVLICGRPKKYETRLRGKVHWKEFIKDDSFPDDPKAGVWINREWLVKENGKWLIPEEATFYINWNEDEEA